MLLTFIRKVAGLNLDPNTSISSVDIEFRLRSERSRNRGLIPNMIKRSLFSSQRQDHPAPSLTGCDGCLSRGKAAGVHSEASVKCRDLEFTAPLNSQQMKNRDRLRARKARH
jgi:hypothetical protein